MFKWEKRKVPHLNLIQLEHRLKLGNRFFMFQFFFFFITRKPRVE